jgi:hypothetical protein
MKRIFTFLFLSAIWSQTMVAQNNFTILAFEDFETATIPADWVAFESTTPPAGATSTTPSDGWAFGETSYTGTGWAVPAADGGFAISNDNVADQDRSFDALASPVFDLTGYDSVDVIFDMFYDGTDGSTALFLVSYDAGANWLSIGLPADPAWSSTIGVTFQYTSLDGTFSDEMVFAFYHSDGGGAGSGFAVDNVIIAGYNNPCDDVIAIASCNAPQTVTLAGLGIVDFDFTGACMFDVPGAEQLYSFTPTTTGAHTLSITSATGTSWIDYMWKEASTGCDTLGWTCLGDQNATGNFALNLTSGTEYLFLLDNEFATSETQTFSIICPAVPGEPCLLSADTWGDLGAAPCVDGACVPADPGYIAFGIYGSETYTLTNVQATYDYVFDVCTGVGAGSWIPEIVILAPDGTTIDAWNGEPATGSTLTHADQCSLEWTATQSGTYSIIINELGTANGDAPGQVDCTTSFATDNGNPTVLCGTNPAPCPVCEAGTLTSPAVQDLCPGESFDVALSGNSTPNSYTLYFDNTTSGGTGGIEAPITITGYVDGNFPLTIDEDINGTLSGQPSPLPPLAGSWEVKVIVVDGADADCDSTASFTVNFLTSADAQCITVGIEENEIGQVNIYPNPSNGSFTVEIADVKEFAQFVVMDVAGREVYSQTVLGSGTLREVLNLNVNTGSYLLQVNSDSGTQVSRIVVK